MNDGSSASSEALPVTNVDVQAMYEKNSRSWKEALPLCPHNASLGSWLFGMVDTINTEDGAARKLGLGCKACHLAGVDSSDSRCGRYTVSQCRLARLKIHASTLTHAQAVAKLTDCPDCKTNAERLAVLGHAPSMDLFRQVWIARREGGPLKVRGISHKKAVSMQWCLAEAVREVERDCLRNTKALLSHVDGRSKRFTMRYSTVSYSSLTRRKGTMGHVVCAGKKYDATTAYVDHTKNIIRKFCTVGVSCPAWGSKRRYFDEDLYSKITEAHRGFGTDGARVMVLVGHELTGVLPDSDKTFGRADFIKDHTHGMRRCGGS